MALAIPRLCAYVALVIDVIEVVIAGAGPKGLMLAYELGLAGIRPVVLDPMFGSNPQPRVNRVVGQAARILDHRGLYCVLTGRSLISSPMRTSAFHQMNYQPFS